MSSYSRCERQNPSRGRKDVQLSQPGIGGSAAQLCLVITRFIINHVRLRIRSYMHIYSRSRINALATTANTSRGMNFTLRVCVRV